MNVFTLLVLSTGLLALILIILLIVMAVRPSRPRERPQVRKRVVNDLDKIKEQVNGDHE